MQFNDFPSPKTPTTYSIQHLNGSGEHKLNSTIRFISKVIYWGAPLGNQAMAFCGRKYRLHKRKKTSSFGWRFGNGRSLIVPWKWREGWQAWIESSFGLSRQSVDPGFRNIFDVKKSVLFQTLRSKIHSPSYSF